MPPGLGAWQPERLRYTATRNTKLAESPKRPTAASEDVETRANRLAAVQMVVEVVAGLRKVAQQKASRKAPNQAA
jgi:hypothetical protein